VEYVSALRDAEPTSYVEGVRRGGRNMAEGGTGTGEGDLGLTVVVIFLQLWHAGRVSHADMTNNEMPVAPSVVPFEGIVVTGNGFVEPSPHRALEIEEISHLVEEFRGAALNAKAAGFDGVEIHGANGYILDQFLQDGTNKRTDPYEGPIQNRARLLFEVVGATAEVWGDDRVGIRLSPDSTYNSMFDSNPEATFGYVADRLNRYTLAYLHVIEPRVKGIETIREGQPAVASALLRKSIRATSSPRAVLIPKALKPSSNEATPTWSPLAAISSPIPIYRDEFNLGYHSTSTTARRFTTTMHGAIPTIRFTTTNSSISNSTEFASTRRTTRCII
jgi:NADH:flavin oxidoreductase / NADH oxidase family